MTAWWSWALTAVGVFGLYLSGKRNYWGWGVGLAAQLLWVAYALATTQWGFIVSAFAYGTVYAKNFIGWRRDADPQQPDDPEMRWAYTVLRDHYTPRGIDIWWNSYNYHTKGVPIEQWSTDRAVVKREIGMIDIGGSW